MSLDIASAAADYLPTLDRLARLFDGAVNKPSTRNELDSIEVALPPDGRISSAGLIRMALKKLAEVFDYEYALNSEVDPTPEQIRLAESQVNEILKTIVKSKPRASTLLNAPGILDRYFYALSTLAELIAEIGSVEYLRIKAGAVKDRIQRNSQKVEGAQNAFKWLADSAEAGGYKHPNIRGLGGQTASPPKLQGIPPNLKRLGCAYHNHNQSSAIHKRKSRMTRSFLTRRRTRKKWSGCW